MDLQVDDPAVTAFTAVIQIGAIFAAIWYFRKDILRLAVGVFRGPGRQGAAVGSTTSSAGTWSRGLSRSASSACFGKKRDHRPAAQPVVRGRAR